MVTDAPAGTFAPTDAERAAMLAGIERLIVKLVRESGCPKQDREDLEQECRLLAWELTARFDPARGCKFSSYAATAIVRMLAHRKTAETSRGEVSLENWDVIEARPEPDPTADATDPDDDTGDEWTALHAAVRRALAAGVLDQLGDGLRRLVERVAFDGLTAAQIAEQTGHPLRVVKTNLKQALKKLAALGATQHAVGDAEMAKVAGPQNQQTAEYNRRRRVARRAKKVVAAAG